MVKLAEKYNVKGYAEEILLPAGTYYVDIWSAKGPYTVKAVYAPEAAAPEASAEAAPAGDAPDAEMSAADEAGGDVQSDASRAGDAMLGFLQGLLGG